MDKGTKLLNSASKQGKLTPQLKYAVSRCISLEEIDVLAAPLKPGSKQSLAAKAAKAGLEQPALDLINGSSVSVSLQSNISFFQTFHKQVLSL